MIKIIFKLIVYLNAFDFIVEPIPIFWLTKDGLWCKKYDEKVFATTLFKHFLGHYV